MVYRLWVRSAGVNREITVDDAPSVLAEIDASRRRPDTRVLSIVDTESGVAFSPATFEITLRAQRDSKASLK